jgi:hypothetical protein
MMYARIWDMGHTIKLVGYGNTAAQTINAVHIVIQYTHVNGLRFRYDPSLRLSVTHVTIPTAVARVTSTA